MNEQVTLGIITCARPLQVQACLESCAVHAGMPYRALVVDSMADRASLARYESFPNTRAIGLDAPVGPAEARKIVAERLETPYLLYLDDDNELRPGTLGRLMTALREGDADIVAGIWHEYGRYRPVGKFFHFGEVENRPVVFKSAVQLADAQRLGLRRLRVDETLATMLLHRDTLDKVGFDPRYDFFFDLWDFFFQCRRAEIRVDSIVDAVFEHCPARYAARTRRQTAETSEDRRRFAEKWGCEPVGSLVGKPGNTLTSLARGLTMRIRRGR